MATPDEKNAAIQTDVEAATRHQSLDNDGRRAPTDRERLSPTRRFSGHQVFYIFVLDGLGAMMLSAGVNFAIAYGNLAPSGPPPTTPVGENEAVAR